MAVCLNFDYTCRNEFTVDSEENSKRIQIEVDEIVAFEQELAEMVEIASQTEYRLVRFHKLCCIGQTRRCY